MSELTLHFEDARAVQALHANDPANLRLLGEALELGVTSRDGWVKVHGEESQIAKAKALLEKLDGARARGVTIRTPEFRYALGLAAQGKADSLERLFGERLAVSNKKPALSPKTLGQAEYLQRIRECDVVFGVGPAGTGKTFLAMGMAVNALRENRVGRILLTRPAVEAGESLGFLPGDLQEKLLPYLRPLYDALHQMLEPDEVSKMLERGLVEIAPLAYMRGRTLSRSFVILDEAQNATTEQMFMFLTRLGPESKCVVTGDPTQIDLPKQRKSGLIEALAALKKLQGVAIHQFRTEDVVRHEIVGRIITAYRKHRGLQDAPETL